MLKQRVVTATVLTIIVLLAIFVLPYSLFYLLVSVAALIGAWEWSALAGFGQRNERIAYCVLLAATSVVFRPVAESHLGWTIGISVLWWLGALALIRVYPRYSDAWNRNTCLAAAGFLVLFPTWLALLFLRPLDHGGFFIFTLLIMVAGSDIGAYFIGKTFGRNKLAPNVSPNKTWEGVAGGVLGCTLLALIFWGAYVSFVLQDIDPRYWLQIFVFAVLLSLLSVVGDLTESMVKRIRQVKDSGSILPGHGGMLDRIDGITAAAPAFLLMALTLGGGAS